MAVQAVKPRLLDLFCGAGGAAMGYHRAGFEVVGVDIKPQPNYPFEFVQDDALLFMREARFTRLCETFDAIHASPPCQLFTRANGGWVGRLSDDRHADLITPTRELLEATGLPYVIENVVGAPLRDPVTICGTTLGLNVKRHRLFESNCPLMVPPCSGHERDYVICFGGGVRGRTHQLGRTPNNSGPILRRPTLPLKQGQEAMEIGWMDRHELSQAIPPAYTELIGHQLLQHIRAKAVA
ncbi:MAG TPA: DNA cytosine methyltransferase [Steroidobacteraceae bacterium]|nr:DNA cytosine methyltransferase [Steroidobacteraceae bacterium]